MYSYEYIYLTYILLFCVFQWTKSNDVLKLETFRAVCVVLFFTLAISNALKWQAQMCEHLEIQK